MVMALEGLASLFLCFGNEGFRIPSHQLKIVDVKHIEKFGRTDRYCARRYSNEQNSLRVERHLRCGFYLMIR